jgi:threonine aldolase
MKIIDLRSDTITLPDEEMVASIKINKLGDDVYREDSLVNELEEKAAKIMGKEAGLLVTSGTQGNLLGILSQTTRGDEIILEKEAHIYYYEVAGLAALAGVMPRTLAGKDGIYNLSEVKQAIRARDIHQPVTKLISVEQTHNRAGGVVIPYENMQAIGKIAQEHNMAFHLDGARVFNAATYLKMEVSKLVSPTTTVQFCLSKGLSAPIGSLLVGQLEVIEKARKFRKMLGGGMRQAGIIAGPGLIALEKMTQRLQEDHDNATALAKSLGLIKGAQWIIKEPQTNIIKITTPNGNAKKIVQELKNIGVKSGTMDEYTVRFVTNRMVTKEDIEEVVTRIENNQKVLELLKIA